MKFKVVTKLWKNKNSIKLQIEKFFPRNLMKFDMLNSRQILMDLIML